MVWFYKYKYVWVTKRVLWGMKKVFDTFMYTPHKKRMCGTNERDKSEIHTRSHIFNGFKDCDEERRWIETTREDKREIN